MLSWPVEHPNSSCVLDTASPPPPYSEQQESQGPDLNQENSTGALCSVSWMVVAEMFACLSLCGPFEGGLPLLFTFSMGQDLCSAQQLTVAQKLSYFLGSVKTNVQVPSTPGLPLPLEAIIPSCQPLEIQLSSRTGGTKTSKPFSSETT